MYLFSSYDIDGIQLLFPNVLSHCSAQYIDFCGTEDSIQPHLFHATDLYELMIFSAIIDLSSEKSFKINLTGRKKLFLKKFFHVAVSLN